MKRPQPPWSLYGVFRESELEKLKAEVERIGIMHKIVFDPAENKPYLLFIHDDHFQRAVDLLFKSPN